MHDHDTRKQAANNLFIKPYNTNHRKFSLKISGPLLWNDAPEAIKILSSKMLFSKKNKEFLLSKHSDLTS